MAWASAAWSPWKGKLGATNVLYSQHFLDFTIFHNFSHVLQYCTLYCTAPVCRCDSLKLSAAQRALSRSAGPGPGPPGHGVIIVLLRLDYNSEYFLTVEQNIAINSVKLIMTI